MQVDAFILFPKFWNLAQLMLMILVQCLWHRCLYIKQVLCKSYPSEFVSYFHYCRSLRFEDKPDYSYLKRLFRDLFIREGEWLQPWLDLCIFFIFYFWVWSISQPDTTQLKKFKIQLESTKFNLLIQSRPHWRNSNKNISGNPKESFLTFLELITCVSEYNFIWWFCVFNKLKNWWVWIYILFYDRYWPGSSAPAVTYPLFTTF